MEPGREGTAERIDRRTRPARARAERHGWNRLLVGALCALTACDGVGASKKDSGQPRGTPRPDSAAGATAGRRPTTTPPPASHAKTVLFVGTSLTAGLGLDPDSAFPQLIQHNIDSAGLPYEVVNAGQSGETSADLVRRLDWLMRGSFDVMVLETGANDGLRALPVAATRGNIEEILHRVKTVHPGARVLLVQMEAPPNLGSGYTTQFHDMFPSLARQTGVSLLPFLLTGVAGHADLNQGDGMHPNMRGERMVADNVWRGLEPLLRGR